MKRHFIFIAFMLSTICCSKIILFAPNLDEIRSRKNFNWVEERSNDGRFTLLYEKGTLNNSDSEARNRSMHSYLNKTFVFMKEPDRGESYTYIIVASSARMKELIGYSPQGTAFPSRNLVIGESAVLQVAHELSHVVSIRCWGDSEAWIKEGLAVAVDNQWFDYDLYALTKNLHSTGEFVNLTDLMHNFRKYDSLITYPEAGCFVKFLQESYGIEKVHALWKQGPSHIPEIFNCPLPELERAWLDRVAQANTTGIKYKTRNQPPAA